MREEKESRREEKEWKEYEITRCSDGEEMAQ